MWKKGNEPDVGCRSIQKWDDGNSDKKMKEKEGKIHR